MNVFDSHSLTLTPQSIADGWQATCTCGWKAFESFYEHPNKDALLERLRNRHQRHKEVHQPKGG